MLTLERGNAMFGKKEKGIPAMHYSGLKGFPQDHPCFIELSGDAVTFRKIKPEVTATLPVAKITSIDSLMEENYMLAYHNDKAKSARTGSKWYFVFHYDGQDGPNHIDLWAVPGKATTELNRLKANLEQGSTPARYSL